MNANNSIENTNLHATRFPVEDVQVSEVVTKNSDLKGSEASSTSGCSGNEGRGGGSHKAATPGGLTKLHPKFYQWLFGAVGFVILFNFMPLFHFVPLKATRQEAATEIFNVQAFVDNLWPSLQDATTQNVTTNAVNVYELTEALILEPGAAAKRFGSTLGLGSSAAYYIFGSGKVISVTGDAVTIEIIDSSAAPGGHKAKVVIELGPIFSNAIRDGSGLLNVSDFSNTQDFNAISAEINRRVEEQVFPSILQKAVIDGVVRFVGGAEVSNSDPSDFSLILTPVVFEPL